MAPVVLGPEQPCMSTGSTVARTPAFFTAPSRFSPMIIDAHVPTTPISLGRKRSSIDLRIRMSFSSAPKIRSLSRMPVVITRTPASSSLRAAMNPQPAGPCIRTTSASRSRSVYMAAMIGLGLG